MLNSNSARFLALGVAGVAVVSATVAGVAIAADPTPTVKAPYAQAAAAVKADGTATKKTDTVASVSRVDTGRYCVALDADVDVKRSVPVATLQGAADWKSEIYVTPEANKCGGAGSQKVLVTTAADGTAKNQAFHILIP
ncbi:hypothetical protein [Streptomyces sp. NPDC017940]|uniref:hypothetical protein n=1 Tax=Streptomyces sp. NPDC017940 TaxID=3365017 RepID=UPI0037A6DD8C